MPATIQPSFARGELSPRLHGRVDTAAYQIGLKTAWNVLIHATGGASNRPGLEFVGPAKTHSAAPRLVPFEFKTTDTYILEFGGLYMRVIRDDSHVVEAAKTITGATQANPVVVTAASHGYAGGQEVAISSIAGMTEINGRRFRVGGTTTDTFVLLDQAAGTYVDGTGYGAYSSGGAAERIYELATPYAIADLPKLKYTQSADVMTLTHPSYSPRELTRTGHDAWTLSEIAFIPGFRPIGVAAVQNGTPGAATYKYAVTAIDLRENESLTGANATVRTITAVTGANPAVVTSAGHGFLNGDEIIVSNVAGMIELNTSKPLTYRRFKVANKTTDTFELKEEDSTTYGAFVNDGLAGAQLSFARVTNGNATLSATDSVTISWSEVLNVSRYVVYRDDNGLWGEIGETESLSFTDPGKTVDLESGPPRFSEPFRGAGNYPAAVGYFEQRRVFGGSNGRPDTSRFSRTGDYSVFASSIPSRADDPITSTLTSGKVNEIAHYVPQDSLLVLTTGAEWKIDSGDNNRFSADTTRQREQSGWGSSHLRPVVIGRVVLFIQDTERVIRSIGYELAVDGYTGTDMSLLAEHIFRDSAIVDFTSARLPDSVLAAVRADGQAGIMTFNQEQEVIAWSRWGTRVPDKLEAAAAIRPSVDAEEDSIYFVVKRIINGQTVRYIERTHSRRFTDVKDCFFVDCGLTYDQPIAVSGATQANPIVLTISSGHGLVSGDEVDVSDIVWAPDIDEVSTETQPAQLNGGRFKVGTAAATTISLQTPAGVDVDGIAFNAYVEGGVVRKAVTTLSGFHHLAGESVVALADGGVVSGLTVSSTGIVTLPSKASRVHVGLRYYSDLETLDLTIPSAALSASARGLLKNVHSVNISLEKSRSLWVGPSAASLTELLQRQDEVYGEPTRLFTGSVEIVIRPSWNSNGRVYLRQRDPLPMTVLAIAPDFEMENLGET